MDTPLVSVIVPVYNAEKFLPRCMESILAQTYANFEVILVDDGSPDNCPALCDEYALRDARVRVLHTVNGGLSIARNRGVGAAAGAYATFIDADDYVDADMIACLVRAIAGGAPMSVCGTRFVDEDGNALPPFIEETRSTLDAEHALTEMLYQRLFFNSAWGKLIPMEIARAFPFPPGQWYEDLATTYQWIDRAGSVAVDTTPCYCYVQHDASFMGRAFTPERFTLLDTSETVVDFISARYPAVLPAARARRFAAYCQVLLQTPEEQAYQTRREQMRARMRMDAPLVLRDTHCRAKDRVAAAVFRFSGENGLRLLWRAARKGGA